MLQPGVEDSDAEHGPAGGARDALHRRPLALLGLHAHPVRDSHRPVRLAHLAEAGRAGALRRAADRARAPDAGQDAEGARLRDRLHRQVAPGLELDPESGRFCAAGNQGDERRGDRPDQAAGQRAAGGGFRLLLRHRRAELPALHLHRGRTLRRAAAGEAQTGEHVRQPGTHAGGLAAGADPADAHPESGRVHRATRRQGSILPVSPADGAAYAHRSFQALAGQEPGGRLRRPGGRGGRHARRGDGGAGAHRRRRQHRAHHDQR